MGKTSCVSHPIASAESRSIDDQLRPSLLDRNGERSRHLDYRITAHLKRPSPSTVNQARHSVATMTTYSPASR